MKLLQLTKPNGEEFLFLTEDEDEAIADFTENGCALVSLHTIEYERGERGVLPLEAKLQVF